MLKTKASQQHNSHGSQGAVQLHKNIEAMNLTYTDLYRYNADPRFAKVPVKGLLAKDYAEQRAALINPDKANCAPVNGNLAKSDTTYLAAVDKTAILLR